MAILSDNIRIVLVNTSHPGNIGSAARAMYTMGFQQLFLVNPKRFPHPDATALAAGAKAILEKVKIVSTLDEAIQGCSVVMGTSARLRTLPHSMWTPRQASSFINSLDSSNSVAIIFGNEQFGLSNEELKKCHYHICIPTAETFSSLNLAAAVQIIVYELFLAQSEKSPQSLLHQRTHLATAEELETLYAHIEETAIQIGLLDPAHPRRLMARMRQIINRSHIDQDELNLLHGWMTSIERHCKSHSL